MELSGRFVKALAALGPYTCFRPHHNGTRGYGVLAYGKRYLGGYRAFHVTTHVFPICILLDPLEKLEFDVLALELRAPHLVVAKLRDVELLLAGEEEVEETEDVEEECKTEASFPVAMLEAVVNAASRLGANIEIKTVENNLVVGVTHSDVVLTAVKKADHIDAAVDVVVPPAPLIGAVKALTTMAFDRATLCVGQKIWLEGESDKTWLQVYIK